MFLAFPHRLLLSILCQFIYIHHTVLILIHSPHLSDCYHPSHLFVEVLIDTRHQLATYYAALWLPADFSMPYVAERPYQYVTYSRMALMPPDWYSPLDMMIFEACKRFNAGEERRCLVRAMYLLDPRTRCPLTRPTEKHGKIWRVFYTPFYPHGSLGKRRTIPYFLVDHVYHRRYCECLWTVRTWKTQFLRSMIGVETYLPEGWGTQTVIVLCKIMRRAEEPIFPQSWQHELRGFRRTQFCTLHPDQPFLVDKRGGQMPDCNMLASFKEFLEVPSKCRQFLDQGCWDVCRIYL